MSPSRLTFLIWSLGIQGIQNLDVPVGGFPHVLSSVDKLILCLTTNTTNEKQVL